MSNNKPNRIVLSICLSIITAASLSQATPDAQVPASTMDLGANAAAHYTDYLSDAELAKLKRVAMTAPKNATVNAQLAVLFELGTVADVIEAKGLSGPRPDGPNVVNFVIKPGSDDIIFFVRQTGRSYSYLADSTRILRRVVVRDATGFHALPLPDASVEQIYHTALQAWSEISKTFNEPATLAAPPR